MAKVMLVEDDNNLREIYGARLLAEGYEIVSAKDGEEALALAVKEKPDLIITDVMMPKISGFDMLDILRSTPETRNTKVIMMTALSQAEDKDRADKLGADRYLVKSQVTLEDVARTSREVLGESNSPEPAVESPQQKEETVKETAQTTTDEPVASPTEEPPKTTTSDPAATPDKPTTDKDAPDDTVKDTTDNTPTSEDPKIEDTKVEPSDNSDKAGSQDNAENQIIGVTNIETVEVPGTEQPPKDEENTAQNSAVESHNAQVLANAMSTFGGDDNSGNSQDKPSQETTTMPVERPKTSVHTKVINPINDLSQVNDAFQKLVAAEEAKAVGAKTTPSTQTNQPNESAAMTPKPTIDIGTPPPPPGQTKNIPKAVVNDVTPPPTASTSY